MPGTKSIPNIEELQALIMNSGEDFLRQTLEKMLNLIMELEVEAKTNAAKHERSEKRTAYRNGSRARGLATGVGEVTLQIPKVRSGESYYPTFLEP